MDNNPLQADMLEAINKNLPAQLSEALQLRLAQGDKACAELTKVSEESMQWRRRILDLEDQLDKHRDLDKRQAALDEQEDRIKERERMLEVKLLQVRLDAVMELNDAMRDFVGQICRNTEYRKETVTNYSRQHRDNWGGLVETPDAAVDVHEETTVVETTAAAETAP